MGIATNGDSVFVPDEKLVSVGVPSLERIKDRFVKVTQCVGSIDLNVAPDLGFRFEL